MEYEWLVLNQHQEILAGELCRNDAGVALLLRGSWCSNLPNPETYPTWILGELPRLAKDWRDKPAYALGVFIDPTNRKIIKKSGERRFINVEAEVESNLTPKPYSDDELIYALNEGPAVDKFELCRKLGISEKSSMYHIINEANRAGARDEVYRNLVARFSNEVAQLLAVGGPLPDNYYADKFLRSLHLRPGVISVYNPDYYNARRQQSIALARSLIQEFGLADVVYCFKAVIKGTTLATHMTNFKTYLKNGSS